MFIGWFRSINETPDDDQIMKWSIFCVFWMDLDCPSPRSINETPTIQHIRLFFCLVLLVAWFGDINETPTTNTFIFFCLISLIAWLTPTFIFVCLWLRCTHSVILMKHLFRHCLFFFCNLVRIFYQVNGSVFACSCDIDETPILLLVGDDFGCLAALKNTCWCASPINISIRRP